MAVFPMIWGFTHEATEKPIVNCRVESADQKAMWKDSWYRRRCIIPASWYYEWGVPPSEVGFRNVNPQRSIKKEKYAIQPEGSETTYLAGLYRFEEHRGIQIPVFAVLTRESVAPVSIAAKALTKMVVEKAKDYPEPIPAFMQIGREIAS